MAARTRAGDALQVAARLRSASITTWPKRSASVTKSPSGSMMVCCTQGALCSSSRRSRCDLPEPELPCTSRRVASSSSKSSVRRAAVRVRPEIDGDLGGRLIDRALPAVKG